MRPNRRRVHSAEFKIAVLAECQRPGASVATVAMSHGLNVNLVRKWLVGRGLKRDGVQAPRRVRPRPSTSGALPVDGSPTMARFIALPLPASTAAAAATAVTAPPTPAAVSIQLEIRRGAVVVNVAWPMAAAEQGPRARRTSVTSAT